MYCVFSHLRLVQRILNALFSNLKQSIASQFRFFAIDIEIRGEHSTPFITSSRAYISDNYTHIKTVQIACRPYDDFAEWGEKCIQSKIVVRYRVRLGIQSERVSFRNKIRLFVIGSLKWAALSSLTNNRLFLKFYIDSLRKEVQYE